MKDDKDDKHEYLGNKTKGRWTILLDKSLCLHSVSCSSGVCQNGGSCYETKNGFTCRCPWRVVGKICQTGKQMHVQYKYNWQDCVNPKIEHAEQFTSFLWTWLFSDCTREPQSSEWNERVLNGGPPYYYNNFNDVLLCMVMNGAQLISDPVSHLFWTDSDLSAMPLAHPIEK